MKPPVPSREVQLLLLCARMTLPEEGKEAVRRLVEMGIDWQRLLELSAWHRVSSFLQLHFGSLDALGVPSLVQENLRQRWFENAARSLRMSAELIRLLAALRDRGVVAVPYKGPTLAARVYGDIALRYSWDLDILLRPVDVVVATELLMTHGYRPREALVSANRSFVTKKRYSEEFERKSDGMVVELHWALTNREVAFPLSLEDFLPRIGEIHLVGQSVPILSDRDLLLTLCVHGAKHRWNRLEWICGVTELLRDSKTSLTIDVLAWARAIASERVVLLGLVLAGDLLAAPLPRLVHQACRTNGSVPKVAAEIESVLLSADLRAAREGFGTVGYDLYQLRLRDTLTDRMRYLSGRLTTPSRPEAWSVLSIGDRFFPLHALARPVKLAGRLSKALWLGCRRAVDRRLVR